MNNVRECVYIARYMYDDYLVKMYYTVLLINADYISVKTYSLRNISAKDACKRNCFYSKSVVSVICNSCNAEKVALF